MEINENTSPFTGDVRDCKHGGNQSRDGISSQVQTCNHLTLWGCGVPVIPHAMSLKSRTLP